MLLFGLGGGADFLAILEARAAVSAVFILPLSALFGFAGVSVGEFNLRFVKLFVEYGEVGLPLSFGVSVLLDLFVSVPFKDFEEGACMTL